MKTCLSCGHELVEQTPLERARNDHDLIVNSLLYHTGWCATVHENGWLCPVCGLFSNHADAVSIAYDNAVAAAHMNHLGSAYTIAAWMLPTPQKEVRRLTTVPRTTAPGPRAVAQGGERE